MNSAPAITVIGCDGSALQGRAASVVAAARCVAGTRRHLAAAELPPGADVVEFGPVTGEAPPPRAGAASVGSERAGGDVAAPFDAALRAILAHPGPVAVLASGDPGFFGIVRALVARGAEPDVIPAVSSVALAFARIGLPWEDALVLSAHGRDPRPVLAAALGCAKAAILTAAGPDTSAHTFVAPLLAAGRTVYVAERLGTPGERLTEFVPRHAGPGESGATCESGGTREGRQSRHTGEAAAAPPIPPFAEPNVLIALDGGPRPEGCAGRRWLAGHLGAPDGWALPEDAFRHRDSMITKAEVRALVLARLGPGPGRTIWDIGAGSGSVAVECARFGAHVIAIETDPAQCQRIRANAAAHDVRLQVAEGSAPGVLIDLPPPSAVFAGGGDDTVLAAAAACHAARVVVTLASVDRVRTVRDLLRSEGYRVDGTALQASRLAPLPGGSVRLAAANPVFVLWGDRT